MFWTLISSSCKLSEYLFLCLMFTATQFFSSSSIDFIPRMCGLVPSSAPARHISAEQSSPLSGRQGDHNMFPNPPPISGAALRMLVKESVLFVFENSWTPRPLGGASRALYEGWLSLSRSMLVVIPDLLWRPLGESDKCKTESANMLGNVRASSVPGEFPSAALFPLRPVGLLAFSTLHL